MKVFMANMEDTTKINDGEDEQTAASVAEMELSEPETAPDSPDDDGTQNGEWEFFFFFSSLEEINHPTFRIHVTGGCTPDVRGGG